MGRYGEIWGEIGRDRERCGNKKEYGVVTEKQYMAMYLPISPHISPYLPTSPYISLYREGVHGRERRRVGHADAQRGRERLSSPLGLGLGSGLGLGLR